MAKKFLSQLLKTENCVRSNDRQCCVICLEEISSLSTRTGVIECQIRLPCNHLVGSYCIATWLHDNNTCPVCRSALFPAQPRPHLEPGTVQGDDDHADDASDDDPHRLHWLAVYSARDTRGLGLSHAARLLSQSIVRRASPMDALRECSRLHLCRLAPYPPSWESWVTYISETIIPIWYCAWVVRQFSGAD